MTIRILLADDHIMLRQTLRTFLEAADEEIEVVAEASDGQEVLDLSDKLAIDMVLMDLELPVLNGIATTEKLKQKHGHIKIIGLSGHTDKRHVLGMLQAGADGYVVKTEAADVLARAIRIVMMGQSYISPELSQLVVASFHCNGKPEQKDLGARERQVLKLLADGFNSTEIAQRLHIAPTTVDVHRRNIMNKLNIHNIAELTKYAIRESIIQL